MKLYRTTGSVPLVAYFLAEDDTDALAKADVALWTEDWEGTKEGDVVVHTVREPASVREIRAEGWAEKNPHLSPEDVTPLSCENFLKMQEGLRDRLEVLRQQVFFFYDKGWNDE